MGRGYKGLYTGLVRIRMSTIPANPPKEKRDLMLRNRHFPDAEKVIFDFIITTPGYPRQVEEDEADSDVLRGLIDGARRLPQARELAIDEAIHRGATQRIVECRSPRRVQQRRR